MEEWADLGVDLFAAEDPEGDRLEDELDGAPVDKLGDQSGDLILPSGDWNTVTPGTPSGCRPRLLVVIDSEANIIPQLAATLAHLAHCNGTHAGKTISVMFYLTDFFPSWQREWVGHRAALEAALGAQQMGLPPIIRIGVRGRPHLTFFTSNGRPAGGRRMLQWWRDADRYLRGYLRQRLAFVHARGVEQTRNCSFIDGYTDQPPGLAGENVLSFGNYRPAGSKIQQWVLRCYLVRGVPIGFAGRIKLHHPLPHPLVLHNPPNPPGSNSGAWVAVDANRFLNTPGDYIDLARFT